MTVRPLKFAVLLLLAGGAILPSSGTGAATDEVQLLVKPKSSMSGVALHALLSAHGAYESGSVPALAVHVIRAPAQAAAKLVAALQQHPDIEYVEPDAKAEAIGTANDPYYVIGSEWHLAQIQAPNAWDITTGSPAVIVAVVDTGVNYSHPDLKDKVLAGYDFGSNDSDPMDENGHGSAVAATIAASSNNQIGVASVSWGTLILPVKVFDASGYATYSSIANGITYATDKGARVINMSLGGGASSRTLQDAVNYAWNKNVVIVAGAGNNGNDAAFYPAACQNVVAVSATNSSDVRTSWSNYGSYIDVAAPGDNIPSVYGADSYAYWSGTSFSSPVAAGIVALMESANPQLSNSQIVDLLLKNSDDIGDPGYDVYYGYGRVNAYRAVAAAKNFVAPDITAPSLNISSPANGAIVAGAVDVSIAATDNVKAISVELYIDGVLLGQSNAASATFSWNTVTYLEGQHTLEARGYDAAGNIGKISITVTVQNSLTADVTAPTVAITSPKDGSKIATRILKIYVASSDNVAVTKVELYRDGYLLGSSTSANPVFSWNTRYAARGWHTLQAYAYDAADNVGASSVIHVSK